MGHPFHQAAVTAEGVGVVIDQVEARTVELRAEQLLRERHTDRVGESLAQRPRRGLDTAVRVVFGVARRFAAELAEVLQVLDGERVAGKIQQRIEQHRAVTVREHEAIAVRPARICRVVPQKIPPQDLGDVGHAHRHAGVSGVRALHRVHGQCADGVGEFAACSHAALGAARGRLLSLRRQVPRFGSRRAHGAGARILHQSRPLLNRAGIIQGPEPAYAPRRLKFPQTRLGRGPVSHYAHTGAIRGHVARG